MGARVIIIIITCWLLSIQNLPGGESRIIYSGGGGALLQPRHLPAAAGRGGGANDPIISPLLVLSFPSSLASSSSSAFFIIPTIAASSKRHHHHPHCPRNNNIPTNARSSPLGTATTTVLIPSGQQRNDESSFKNNDRSFPLDERTTDDDDGEDDPFTLLSAIAATTLLQSDRRRDAVGKESGAPASSATNWIDEGGAFALRRALDKMELRFPNRENKHMDAATAVRRRSRDNEEATAWLRWMRSAPAPVVIDLSNEARSAANGIVSDDFLELLNASSDNITIIHGDGSGDCRSGSKRMHRLRMEFLERMQCRLILLPSGRGLRGGLREPAGSLTFAKLLCGGATRYRILPSSTSSKHGDGGGDHDATTTTTTTTTTTKARPSQAPRRAGERTERKSSRNERVPSWVQYGGTERRYDAVDMGPAMIFEWTLLPKIRGVEDDRDGDENGSGVGERRSCTSSLSMTDMVLKRLAWKPQSMFQYAEDEAPGEVVGDEDTASSLGIDASSSLHGKDRNDALSSGFRSRVGGLGQQIDAIVRRVLDGRVIRPAEVDDGGNFLSFAESRRMLGGGIPGSGSSNNDDFSSLDDASRRLTLAALEAEELASLGLTPVKGLLLYGPPGCGKTALAREIARALRARAPKIVSAPELLDRWVGGSERLVRELFQDAEAELASVNGDASRSALHVIVIDEIDAVFRKRSSAEDSGEATRSSTVNQILSKLDGVEAISNVLLIGMTNRRELLDEALLRPGRLEVQIEIPLPDREGRREILRIHFDALRRRGRLSQPLCDAIDGVVGLNAGNSFTPKSSKGRKRRAMKQATAYLLNSFNPIRKPVFDLADSSVTGGYSGADLEGLVRCSGSLALSRTRLEGVGIDGLLITLDDVKQALLEVKN